MKVKTNKIIAVYRGDTFVDVGTAEEIAERQGCTASHLLWQLTPSGKNRPVVKNGLSVVYVGDEPQPLAEQLRDRLHVDYNRAERLAVLGNEGAYAEMRICSRLLSFIAEWEAAARKWEDRD